MKKKLDEIVREDLLNANERIEFASRALTMFTDEDFQSGRFEHDIGEIIKIESAKIKSIIGSYDELPETVKSGEPQE